MSIRKLLLTSINAVFKVPPSLGGLNSAKNAQSHPKGRMKSFFKVVLLSLRYKWSIIGSVACAVMISLLWSMSITTIFPIVKIVVQDETAISWVASEIKDGHATVATVNGEIAEMMRDIGIASPEEALKLGLKLNMKQDRLKSEIGRVAYYEDTIQPIVNQYAPTSAFETLVWSISFLLVVSVLKGFFLVGSAFLTARVASKTVMDLRRIYYRKALELDQRRIDRVGTSNIMTHLSHNMLMVNGGLRMFYGKCIREPMKMVTCLICAAWISLPLLLISLVMVPAGGLLIRFLSRRMKNSTQSEMNGMSDVFQSLIETFHAVKTVRIFNRERTERRRFKKCSELLYQMSLRISFYDSLLRPITEVLGIISISIALLAGAYLVLNQQTHLFGDWLKITNTPLKPEQLILFYALLAGASDPARKMTEVVNVLIRGGTAGENLHKTYDVEHHVDYPRPPTPMPLHSQSIEFEDVIFTYKPREPVLRKVNLTVPYQQTLAIVGGNGCGKSTLMHLLARFYDPNRGTVRIDGVDLKEVNPRKLRRQMAWVTQDSQLFQGTLWENIAYGSRNATDQQIMQAAKIARLPDFVDTFQNGYQTIVGDDGGQLSAGQRQRVALARAIVADPRIFILDEATSQIDGKTEGLIHDELAEFIKSRTTIIITHRRSSLSLADRVVVMQRGRIVHDSSVANADKDSLQFQNLFARSA